MTLRTFAALIFLLTFQVGEFAHGQVVVGFDDFDGGGTFLSRTVLPDNSNNGGTFSSSFDVFGTVDRTVNSSFEDATSVGGSLGLVTINKTDQFFGVADLDNPDNPSGSGRITYSFDVSGFRNLRFDIELAAMGDFEFSDVFTFSASFDGGESQTLFDLRANEDVSQTYTFDDNSTEVLNDPLELNGNVLLDNSFRSFRTDIMGSGSVLTLIFDGAGNGGNESLAFDNLKIVSVPEPAMLPVLAVLAVGLIRPRQK